MGHLISRVAFLRGAPACARPRAARRRAAPWRPAAAVLAACLWAPAVLAFAPADALAATPDSERTLRQAAAVGAAERALGLRRAGTDVTLSARPALSYGADVEDPAALGARADVELDLAWRYDRAAVLADRVDLLLARERLRHDRRRDVLDALRLQAKVLRAELAVRRAELDLAKARFGGRVRAAPPDAAPQTPAPQSPTPQSPTPQSPALRRAEALVDARRHALAALRAQAARLGFTGDARFVPLGFALPQPGAAPPRRERLLLALERAAAERDAVPFDVLRDVTLSATYESRSLGYQVRTSLSLDRGRPAADLNTQLGAQQDDQWSVELSAHLRLDGGAAAERDAAEERVRRARAELDALDATYPDDVARARTAVDDASALLEAELAAWRDAAAAPAASPSACRALLARENAVYGAWMAVIGATYDYLEQADGSWQAASSPSGAPRAAWPERPSDCASGAGTSGAGTSGAGTSGPGTSGAGTLAGTTMR